ncbi:AMP-binding protein [Aquimarina brevivitae]|uniref:O-succinylbenzoic acid--CoA ligase n=1 Tax=Aquimarina brevivitae TaxID=323412 RepID=A0A4Q7P2B7_9FLAO|nr:AMP-binding protein [Aquimarina brevivitae]RZS93905.1 O-succinylbenzoic acid--CoA ligase [Aquimarina brevivitae]
MSIVDTPIQQYIHHKFTLNGRSFTSASLQAYVTDLKQVGEPYEQDVAEFILEWLDDKEYVVAKTSGSTGDPKKIEILKKHMIHSARATGRFFKVEEGTSALLCLSATYIAGKMMLVRAMTLGWKLDLAPPKTNPLDNVYKQYDFCALVPLQLDNSLNRLHLIKKLIVGGGVISENLKQLVQGIATKVYETYGMTETVSHIAARRINPKKKEVKKYFKALPNITLSVDDRNCLRIKAPELAKHPIQTNDVVELKTYKKFLWKGRYDNVVNSGGVKLFPETIESKLQLLIPHRFFITSQPDDSLGERLILIIECDYDPEIKKELQKAIRKEDSLAKYEVPKEIYFLPQFIETPTGKIQRTKTLEFIN